MGLRHEPAAAECLHLRNWPPCHSAACVSAPQHNTLGLQVAEPCWPAPGSPGGRTPYVNRAQAQPGSAALVTTHAAQPPVRGRHPSRARGGWVRAAGPRHHLPLGNVPSYAPSQTHRLTTSRSITCHLLQMAFTIPFLSQRVVDSLCRNEGMKKRPTSMCSKGQCPSWVTRMAVACNAVPTQCLLVCMAGVGVGVGVIVGGWPFPQLHGTTHTHAHPPVGSQATRGGAMYV